MRQQTLAMQNGFEKFARKSRRELFLDEMDKIVPWGGLVALVGPYYPKGENGRAPVGLERMPRLCFLQQWFNLADPGQEDALYESAALCYRYFGWDTLWQLEESGFSDAELWLYWFRERGYIGGTQVAIWAHKK